MRGNKAKSRMAHYQQSSGIQIDEIPQSRPQQINDIFEAEQNDLDNVEIAFDPNEIIANFGTGNDRDDSQENAQEREILDPFADIPIGMRNASSNGSDFYDQEDQDNVAEMQPVVQTSTIEPEFNFPTTVNEIDKGFINEIEETEDDNNNNAVFKPFTLGSLAQIPNPVQSSSTSTATNNVNSYMNYQMGAAMRGAQKKKPAVNKAVNNNSQNKKPDILQMDNDDIGEVGEWVGKSANVNAKRDEDDEEDESEEKNNNDSDDFDGIFDAPAEKNKPAVTKNPKKNAEDEEESGGKFDFEAVTKQSNLAMQKAQGSTAFKAAKNRGPFMNSLKEKADKLKKVEDVATGDEVKFKQTLQFGLDVSNNMKTSSSTNPASKNGDNAPMNETEKDEEESPKPISQQIANKANIQKAKIEAQKDKITNKLEVDVKKKAAEMDLFSGSENASPVQNLEDEWDRVTKVTAQQASQKEGKADEITVLNFNEAWEIAKKINLADEKRRVQEEVNASRGFLQKLFSCGKGGLPAPLLDERDQILALAKVPFNESDDFHFNLLQSIYIKITGKVKEVPRFGPHWETIGFQGRDPATDLRGVGILGLLQILAFVTNHEQMFKKMWKHSTHEKYNFPLCISGFSVTQAMMETLRAEKLNGAIIARKSVIEVFNEGYYATFYKLVNIYETNTYTIAEYPIAKKSAIDMLKMNPTKMLFDFKAASMSLMSPLSK